MFFFFSRSVSCPKALFSAKPTFEWGHGRSERSSRAGTLLARISRNIERVSQTWRGHRADRLVPRSFPPRGHSQMQRARADAGILWG